VVATVQTMSVQTMYRPVGMFLVSSRSRPPLQGFWYLVDRFACV
jgi:hypothetical protein